MSPTKTEPITSYVYDWQRWYTDDPQFAPPECLPYGEGNQVFLNGVDVSKLGIVGIKTGPSGWIDAQEGYPNNTREGPDGKLVTYRLIGNVRYVYNENQ